MTAKELQYRRVELLWQRDASERRSDAWRVLCARVRLVERYWHRALLAEGRALPWWMRL